MDEAGTHGRRFAQILFRSNLFSTPNFYLLHYLTQLLAISANAESNSILNNTHKKRVSTDFLYSMERICVHLMVDFHYFRVKKSIRGCFLQLVSK